MTPHKITDKERGSVADLQPMAAKVLRMLERAANEGRACPTNAEIAEAMGVNSVGSASSAVSRLVDAGLILLERGQCTRAVTIVATGARTAGKVTPHWRDRPGHVAPKRRHVVKQAVDAVPAHQITAARVERDPCPRCGIRRDIGCGHTASRLINREALFA